MTHVVRRDAGALRPADRPLGELVTDVSRDLGLLVRQEVELAKSELRESVKQLAKGAISLAVGAALGYVGLLTLVAAFALILVRLGAPPWLAVLLLAAVLLASGLALVQHATRAFGKAHPVPARAVASIKDTVELVKERVS